MGPRIDPNHARTVHAGALNALDPEPASRKRASRQGTSKLPTHRSGHELAGQVGRGQRAAQVANLSLRSRFDQIQRTLSDHPERADAMIDQRLRGHSATDRAIVKMAVAQRGNQGSRRYADAENVLTQLSSLSPEERKDVLGIMKAGTSFAKAIADERAELARLASRPTGAKHTPAELRKKAIANAQREADAVAQLVFKVKTSLRGVGGVSRSAELLAGAGSAAGLASAVTNSHFFAIASRSLKPYAKVAERAGDAGELMAGGLSARIRKANETASAFFSHAQAFDVDKRRFDRAVAAGDDAGMAMHQGRMDAHARAMLKDVRALDAEAKVVAKWHGKLAIASVEAMVQVAAFAFAEAPEAVNLAYVLEKGVEEGVSLAVEHAAHRKYDNDGRH